MIIISTGIIPIIKQAALEATEAVQYCDLRFGTVVTAAPISISITNSIILPSSMLVIPEHLTDREIEVSILEDYEWETEETVNNEYKTLENESTEPEKHTHYLEPHKHKIMPMNKKLFVHDGLRVGDSVILIRKQGGQTYYVAGRI